MKKFRLFLIATVLILPQISFAQIAIDNVPLPKSLRTITTSRTTKNGEVKERKIKINTGGYFGLQLGTNIAIDLSPRIGFYPFKNMCIGIGGTYMFMSQKSYGERINTHIFGGNAFVEGYFWDKLVLHASYEFTNYPRVYAISGSNETYTERVNTQALLLGGGYQQRISNMVSLYGLILFDVLNDTYSFYSNPQIRVGVNVSI